MVENEKNREANILRQQNINRCYKLREVATKLEFHASRSNQTDLVSHLRDLGQRIDNLREKLINNSAPDAEKELENISKEIEQINL